MSDRDLLAEAENLVSAQPSDPTATYWWLRNNLPALLERIETLQRGGQTLGKSLVKLNQIALDATGMHDVIDEDGDGDWGAVWENVADLGERCRLAEHRIAELEAERDAARDIARSNSHALDAAHEAIDAMQNAHESQLTRMSKERARLQRKIDRLEAKP
ncbi:hypothetical protein [Nocardia asiatica]|uniref:hypothetical protein n=1 Tax=Nocardia asiatica TaxID=209252 RepID=UPI00245412A0|nr:hypothetical protein [Nocardia asiatica]